MVMGKSNLKSIRQAAVASMFYPGEFKVLRDEVQKFLKDSKLEKNSLILNEKNISRIRAIIVPHAGYIYSGEIAGSAYRLLQKNMKNFKRVLILGPAHRVWLNGAAFPKSEIFETPLGKINLDIVMMEKMKQKFPWISVNEEAHLEEHCIEVQLPFLQETLDEFLILPIVVGEIKTEQIAEIIELLSEDWETLIVISTDLSHYHDYQTATARDMLTAKAIENMELEKLSFEDACGLYPLRGLLYTAKRKGWEVSRLGICNSGDTSGDLKRVVGYGAWALNN